MAQSGRGAVLAALVALAAWVRLCHASESGKCAAEDACAAWEARALEASELPFERLGAAALTVAPKVRDRRCLPDSHMHWMPEELPAAREDFPAVFNFTGSDPNPELTGPGLDALLAKHLPRFGAVVVKGLRLASPAGFAQLMHSTNMTLVDYVGGVTSRPVVAPKVTPASSEAPHVSMEPHMDNPYWPVPPERLVFWVQSPAQVGGQALLTDSRQVLRQLQETSPEVLAELQRRHVRYEHFYPDKSVNGPVITSWQDALAAGCSASEGCNATKVAEDTMCERGFGFEWVPNGLKRWELVPPVRSHPTTGEETWANMLTAMHCTVFDNHLEYPEYNRWPDERSKPCTMRGQMPYHTTYGDGGEVPVASLHAVRQAQWDNSVSFDFEAGDLLAIDNFFAMHGRFSFEPPRELFLVMVGA
mmetsp:Transcript_61524/g.179817  ORF Transcript_61524/g.179817 Transcript_61524/m.179817 type:complete len:418 (+) Transcript_61524:68-1321(+)